MTARDDLIEAMARAHCIEVEMDPDAIITIDKRLKFPRWHMVAKTFTIPFLVALEAHAGGCVVVPRFATSQMMDAGDRGSCMSVPRGGYVDRRVQWDAMIAASPYAPETKPWIK